ncbi:ATP-grasp domain-containing protein [Desmospora profundinema]|uniref:Glutathione synthase/RimK-type ligase-like ATP-grasp enzyme n=1 Tax=Desmospora profundinema TaxID=1571184 RepID=A0ABU1IP79_9BACL|nr:hypothetical protein [Desmospora profundinema]MDR6226595.1 glutathione synthase/RimK-type ligase-like ATP-grasp enzyme [Desmospora profundinema]
MKRIYWIFPDRSSTFQSNWERTNFWDVYKKAAEESGFSMEVVSAEAIEVIYLADHSTITKVYGQEVFVHDTIFVTEIHNFPHQQCDFMQMVNTFWTLRKLGFYLPIDPELSLIMGDKLNTFLFFRDLELPVLPSIRIVCGRDLERHNLPSLLESFEFPLIIKPLGWGGGLGVNLATNYSELKGILSLASGAETAMMIQPALDSSKLVDYRVYFIDGSPHTILSRRPQGGDIIANLSRGGETGLITMPDGLNDLAAKVANEIQLPYCCVDFLYDGERYWLSEVELDGGIPYIYREESLQLLKRRFEAYGRAHRQFLLETAKGMK